MNIQFTIDEAVFEVTSIEVTTLGYEIYAKKVYSTLVLKGTGLLFENAMIALKDRIREHVKNEKEQAGIT